MLTLYKHSFTVTVISPECSPDTIIHWLEHAPVPVTDHATRITAEADSAVRRTTPFIRVPDPPQYDGDQRQLQAYHAALDAWIDSLPTVDTWQQDYARGRSW